MLSVKLENIDQQIIHTIHVLNVPLVKSRVVIELRVKSVSLRVLLFNRIFVNVAPDKNGRGMITNAFHAPLENTQLKLT